MNRKELVRLVAGFKRFRQKYFDVETSVYRKLSSGQTPKTLIIGCSDSRVDPALLSSASPGDLFIVRNVANLVPPYEENGGFHGVSSAIEFAVLNLKVENVIVLGHRQCGGIRALMAGPGENKSTFISRWVSIAEDAKQRVLAKYAGADPDELCHRCELESIRTSLRNLRTFPFVQEAIETRQMNLIGAYFDLEEGRLLELNEATGEFSALPL
ncbi:MAG: carbonic anhydrase [Bdellovibrionales bacterium]|jgi:carbonic anhydrase|nr:carbonic anhydrase [Bdellovibrionales bacterium]